MTTFDPLVDERVAPGVHVQRDADDNPLIAPRGSTETVPYTRASALSKYLAQDTWALSRWRGRYAIQGVAKHPDLAMRAAAVHYSTGPISGTQPISERKRAAAELDAVWEEACTRAGINEAANIGTAGHSLTEPGNGGVVHEGLVDVVAGYNEVTASLERVASEVFVANDGLRCAGTFDSLYRSPEFPDVFVIGDTKTGKNYHQAEFEIQLAVYAGGEVYLGPPVMQPGQGRIRGDGAELPVDQRLTFEEFAGLPIHRQTAYLVHVSVTGSPKPRVIKLDLVRGWRLALAATHTRDARAELDRIGIGEKYDHRAWNRTVLDEELEKAVAAHDQAVLTGAVAADLALQARGRELYKRFKHCWTESDTLLIKGRLG